MQACEAWNEEADAVIRLLQEDGRSDEAELLAGYLAGEKFVHDPGTFELVYPTAFGREMFKIVGIASHTNTDMAGEHDKSQEDMDTFLAASPDAQAVEDQSSRATTPTTSPGGPATDTQLEPNALLALAVPAEIKSPFINSMKTIDPMAAVRDFLWISWTDSYYAFCITCSCTPMLVPTFRLGSNEPTHEFVPRHFHEDPLENDAAAHHLDKIHGQHYESTQHLIQACGLRGSSCTRQLVNELLIGRSAPYLGHREVGGRRVQPLHPASA